MFYKHLLLFLFCFSSFLLFSQNYKAKVYNLKNGSIDSIIYTLNDSTKIEDYTQFYIGNYNNNISQLDNSIPYDNICPNTNFTLKQRAIDYYNIEDFPIRTSVVLFRMQNDTLRQTCSGSIISGKNVLTASHCVSSLSYDTLLSDSFMVCPVYNNGNTNRILDCSWVDKIYTFKNNNLGWEDIAVLELEKSIGLKTGWIGIGYNDNDSLLGDGIFYKFSYPGTTILTLDSNEYNGDTLYFSYGKVDYFSTSFIGIHNYQGGIPGESGSSIIKTINNEFYVSYGVLSFSGFLRHSRINNATFHAIEEIINPYLNINNLIVTDDLLFKIYPNPGTNYLNIDSKMDVEISSCSIISMMGYKLMDIEINTLPQKININDLANGYYILKIVSNNKVYMFKFIKV